MSAVPAAVASSHAERQLLFRHVMGRFATGVTVVTTRIGDETFGTNRIRLTLTRQ